MPDIRHPTFEQLQAFAKGKLDEQASAEIESHLSLCGDCLALLGECEIAEDTFVARLVDRAQHGGTVHARMPMPDLEDSPRQIGPFKLLQKIGEGGMGTVWMADQFEPVRRRVALKVIKTGVDSKQIVARFEAERQALAMMDHQNIAKVLDCGVTDDGRPYFAMELVQGIPFTDYCDQNKLTLKERLQLFVPVCQAVQHAHQKGIIHRDLKPSNVLVTLYDGIPVPKVIDFGLAKALQRQIHLTDKTMFTEFGQVVGTLQYMSPEQAEMNALAVDTRTDIYSLGVMLYELLTGSTPLEKEMLAQNALLNVLASIKETEPPRPSARLSDSGDAITGISAQRRIAPSKLQQILRGELDWVVMKALDKDRTRRYPTAAGFADDVQRYLNDEPVAARPPSLSYRIRKFARKHRGFVAATALVLTLLITAVAVSSWFAYEADNARRDSETKTQQIVAEKANVEQQRDRADGLRAVADAAKAELEVNLAKANNHLAVAHWISGNVADARQSLSAIPARHREIEWRLAQREFEGSDLTCNGHLSPINSIDYSPRGDRIVTASRKGATIKTWDTATGDRVRTWIGHQDEITCVRFSPDGATIASKSSDGTIKIWNAENAQELLRIDCNGGRYDDINFSPDGLKIVSGTSEGLVCVWNANTGEELQSLEGHSGAITSVCFSSDGALIASASADSSIRIWDAADGAEVKLLNRHNNRVLSVRFSPDASRIVSGGDDRLLRIWDTSTGENIRTLGGHRSAVFSVEFIPDGRLIASASADASIRLWDVVTGNETRVLKGHTSAVEEIAISPDGSRLASGSWDKSAKIWDLTTDGESLRLRGHTDAVIRMSFSPDSRRIATASRDSSIRIWDTATGKELHALLGHLGWVNNVSISPDGSTLVSSANDGTVRIWDAGSGEEIRTLAGHTGRVRSALSSDGRRIVSASSDETVKIWDAGTGEELLTIEAEIGELLSVCFSPDGKHCAAGNQLGVIKVWNASNGEQIQELQGHNNFVNQLQYYHQGARIASASNDTSTRIWDGRTGSQLQVLSASTSPVDAIAISPSGVRLVTAGGDGLRIWDTESGAVVRTIPGIAGSVCVSPDGSLLAYDNSDSSVSIWNTSAETETRRLKGHSNFIICESLSPDARYVATGCMDHSIKIWDTVTGRELLTLLGHTQPPTSVRFSVDGTHLYSASEPKEIHWDNVSESERIVWDVKAAKMVPNAAWISEALAPSYSASGDYWVTHTQDELILVDISFKRQPWESAFRQAKSRPRIRWHLEQAEAAALDQDWYGEVFHRACVAKSRPEDLEARNRFQEAYTKLESEFAATGRDVLPVLPPVAKDLVQ